ncbi:hypothetical protein [Chitinophaga caseinilytica]|uniref:Uncharacterized protein n=1 Tax=Chitinophaga caseinilytica TaxID=2267521 RepID=A0ABZ2Z2B2_9BACT
MKKQFTSTLRRYGALVPMLFLLFVSACSKKGDPGPKGDNGKDGNANVMVFNFGPQTITSAINLTIDVSRGKMDSSMILVFYNPETELESAWYPMPGVGSGSLYETRFLTYQSGTSPSRYTVAIRLMTLAGAAYATQVKFRKLRIFVVPANTMVNARQAPLADYSDYAAVLRYYGIAAL